MKLKNRPIMKIISLLTLLMFLFITGCKEYSNENISGVYVTQWKDEFAKTSDTMIITRQRESKDYQITRHMCSRFYKKSKKPVFKIAYWTAVFNNTNLSLLVNNNGRTLFYYPQRNELISGTVIYKKM